MTETKTQQPRVGVALLLLNEKGKYLLHERKGKHGGGTYSFPGGALDLGEEPIAAVFRELREEAGITCDFPSVFVPRPYVHTIFDDGQQWVTLYFVAASSGQQPKVMEPEKNNGWRWAAPTSFPDPLFAPLKQVLRHLREFPGSDLHALCLRRAQENVTLFGGKAE